MRLGENSAEIAVDLGGGRVHFGLDRDEQLRVFLVGGVPPEQRFVGKRLQSRPQNGGAAFGSAEERAPEVIPHPGQRQPELPAYRPLRGAQDKREHVCRQQSHQSVSEVRRSCLRGSWVQAGLWWGARAGSLRFGGPNDLAVANRVPAGCAVLELVSVVVGGSEALEANAGRPVFAASQATDPFLPD